MQLLLLRFVKLLCVAAFVCCELRMRLALFVFFIVQAMIVQNDT